jgi:hypothetical protein
VVQTGHIVYRSDRGHALQIGPFTKACKTLRGSEQTSYPAPCLDSVHGRVTVRAVHNSYNVGIGYRQTNGSSQASKTMAGWGKWTIDVRAIVQVAAVCTLILALLAFLHRGPREAQWPLMYGTIQDTRIIADHALQTKLGGQVTWRADYKVTYAVASHEYFVWTDSGIRGQSEDDVRLALPRARPACRVRFNPHKAEVSVADCR